MNLSIRHLFPHCAAVPLDSPTTTELVLQREGTFVYPCYHWDACMGMQGDRWWHEHHIDQDWQQNLGFCLQLGVPQRHERRSFSMMAHFYHNSLTVLQSMIGNYGTMVSKRSMRIGSSRQQKLIRYRPSTSTISQDTQAELGASSCRS
jgi:hypothetical protein